MSKGKVLNGRQGKYLYIEHLLKKNRGQERKREGQNATRCVRENLSIRLASLRRRVPTISAAVKLEK